MKKAGIFTLTVILIMAMFSGCRGQSSDTTMTTGATNSTSSGTTNSTAKATQTTTRATLPAPVITQPSSSESKPMAPSGTDSTGGTEMPRMYPGPRY